MPLLVRQEKEAGKRYWHSTCTILIGSTGILNIAREAILFVGSVEEGESTERQDMVGDPYMTDIFLRDPSYCPRSRPPKVMEPGSPVNQMLLLT
jgi:hypothetical protein